MNDEAGRLAAVDAYHHTDTDTADLVELQGLCELAARAHDVPAAAINLIDDSCQHQIATFGSVPTSYPGGDSMGAVTLREGTDVAVADASQDPRYSGLPCVDGRTASVRFYSSSLLITPEGRAVGTLCVSDDVPHAITATGRRAMSLLAHQVINVLELRRARADLACSQEELAGFAGQLSHDLKTPLTAVLGFTELLLDMPSIAKDQSAIAFLERCQSAGRRMQAMIERLLGYARVAGTPELRPVPLAEVMAQVMDALGATSDSAQVSWSSGTVLADPTQLQVLLQNLVGNSLAYRRADRAAEVRIEVRAAHDSVDLLVVDNGTGIPPDKRADVLLPLIRLRTDVPGSGLGLATCARIVRAHGGTIAFADTPGGGTTVTVRLPTPA